MAEPYVPIARLTTASALLTELEVTTVDASSNANALSTAVSNALASKTTAENLVAQGFELTFLVGA